jgi:hypothetical protein
MSKLPDDLEPPRDFTPIQELLAILFLTAPVVVILVLFALNHYGNPLIPFLEWVDGLEGGWSP